MRSEGFEQLRQRVIAAYHLKPLDVEEVRGYVKYRLTTAGWKDDPRIDDEVFEAIHEFTGGVPRRINTLCDRILLFGSIEELHHITLESFRAVTRDILEEQGATTGELRGLDPNNDPDPDPDPRPVAKEPRPRTAVVAPSEAEGSSERLEAMETSVASLAEAMREEMSLLREALMARKNDDKES
jgi:general secretion pathway protein A